MLGLSKFKQQTIEQWKYVFLITAGMLLVCGFIYVIFSESNLADWNTPLGFEAVPISRGSQELSQRQDNLSWNDESSSDIENSYKRDEIR